MTTSSTLYDERRLRGICLAAVVVVLHGLAAFWLLRTTLKPPELSPEALTWVTLPLLVEESPRAPAPKANAAQTPSVANKQRTARSPAAVQAPPSVTEQPAPEPAAPALAALGQYLSCDLSEYGHRSEEDERNCEAMKRALPAKAYVPQMTEEEEQRARGFAHSKAVEDAAILFPCASPGGLNPLCLLAKIVTGSDLSIGSYADAAPPNVADPTTALPPNLGLGGHRKRK